MPSRPVLRQTHVYSVILCRYLRTQPQYKHGLRESVESMGSVPRPASLSTPRQLVRYLDEYVVGQESAKKVLSVAVYNHYNRIQSNQSRIDASDNLKYWNEEAPDNFASPAQLRPHPVRTTAPEASQLREQCPLFEKSNVLVIGPTGSGKTLLARTLARVLDVPFSVSDATSFTQAGYVGEDVEMAIQRLLIASGWDEIRASTGIIYIDEIDKIARRVGTEGQRDVGGEGVQQALLRMIEGAKITIQGKPSSPASVNDPGSIGEFISKHAKHDAYTVDTTNVLFILSGAFVGLENILQQRMSKGSIGFAVNLSSSDGSAPIPFFTSNHKATSNILDAIEPADLVKYGFIPEFISRMPTITSLAPLTPSDLLRILTEVRGSLVSQYSSLFAFSGVEVRFTTPALREICHRASERGGGARGLRGIMESILLDAMFEVPGSPVKHVLITQAVARGERGAFYWTRGEGAAFWNAWAEEEETMDKQAS